MLVTNEELNAIGGLRILQPPVTSKAPMTAHELAALLLTYPDLPVSTMVVAVEEDGTTNDAVCADDNLSLEIHTDTSGVRRVAVVANTPASNF